MMKILSEISKQTLRPHTFKNDENIVKDLEADAESSYILNDEEIFRDQKINATQSYIKND